ncbi:hypothetical protein POJ06DRAFT_269256 [Lipomyces tetrasporus]|uniref:B30.2/SPRY domain-containing protein n=1 Tax=Lipomyces tetrasporus TaxID=54092 RepID=A0AAD7VSN3_9ASCO|nr:uncharacterized protein POJ06DRAFT_269256 [Lipomyces tetrasporus]KAJ8099190.1 hypothetical protein POJ06DRAFT_269256 [Lipomyces tetrasporus]
MSPPALSSQPKGDEDSYCPPEDAHPVANHWRTDACNRLSESPQGNSARETLSAELPPKYTLTTSVSLPGYTQDSGTVPFSPPSYMPAPSSYQKPLYSHAPDSEHEHALKFCAENPVSSPRMLMDSELKHWGSRHFGIDSPVPTVSPSLAISSASTSSGGFFRGLKGKAKLSSSRAPEVTPDKRDGTIYIRTKPKSTDMTFTTSLPMFSPQLRLTRSLLYYEITIMAADGGVEDSSVAIGFLTMPYPVATRLPGWHRCSIAVHSDDGRRYVADPLSGRDFLGEPVRVGDTVGIGMDFNGGNVFATKNGRWVGGWSMFEELNGASLHDGQMNRFYSGELDVYGAVGVFGGAGILVNFGNGTAFKWREFEDR